MRSKTPYFVLSAASLAFALGAALECHAFVVSSFPDAPWIASMLYGVVLWGWWGVLAASLWMIAERGETRLFSWRATAVHAVIAPVLALGHLWMLEGTITALVRWWPGLGPAGYSSLQYFTVNRFCLELLLYGFAVAMMGLVHLKLATQREELRTVSLKQQLSQAHLRALQMQMEPHFLFNTLNAIASLVELDRKQQAIETLERLNAILHRTLGDKMPARIRVAQELDLLEDYLAIEQTRFADRLQVDMAVDPEALGGMVPCFLMQPLIENAIRHGISRSEEGGSIRVSVQRKDSRLRLEVRDSGAGMEGRATANGHGIGLRNTRERLSHLYGERFELRAEPLAAGGFEVAVELPYEREAV